MFASIRVVPALVALSLWAAAASAQPGSVFVQDATGQLLGPVMDYRFMIGAPETGFAAFSVVVGGKVAILQANRNKIIGGGIDGAVFFATTDCSGQAYIDWDPSWITPPSSIGGPLNTVYVGDVSPVVVHPNLQSLYFQAGGACMAQVSHDAVAPVAPVGTLPAVPPFSLVPGPALAVPAADRWALVALGILLASAAWVALHRRSAAA
jgi:hypothetical protein